MAKYTCIATPLYSSLRPAFGNLADVGQTADVDIDAYNNIQKCTWLESVEKRRHATYGLDTSENNQTGGL